MSLEGWNGPVHPAANLFPLMAGDEFDALVEDVKRNGLIEPVWLSVDGELLDGRNRVRACYKAGIKPTFREYRGDDPVEFVWSTNVNRRHLTATQMTLAALKRGELDSAKTIVAPVGAPKKAAAQDEPIIALLQEIPRAPRGITANQVVAERAGVSPRTVASVARVIEQAPDLVPEMEAGRKSAAEAERELRRRINQEEAKRLRAEPLPLPQGKYAVIELDPPWSYEEQGLAAAGNRNAEDKYATMTLAEIKALPVADLAADNAHLYLWTTANHLRHSWDLLEAWGFEYRSLIVWHKSRIGMGHYYRNQAEFVLFGVKGRLPLLAHDEPNVFQWEAPRVHSAKPEGFYELVERCSPSPRVRLFARAQRPGWESWGNQS